MKYLNYLLLLTVACTTPESGNKFTDATPTDDPALFSDGRVIAGTLTNESRDTYTLQLEEGTFVYGEANQITVDVVISIYDPDQKKVTEFDGPGTGPEPFFFDSEKPGAYTIEVAPFEEETGDYTIVLKRKEPVATIPENRVDQLMAPYDDDKVPGGVIGVIQNGEIIFSKAYGLANLTHQLPFTVNTPSNIGSVSKQFTAFAILLLEQQGKLSLDDNVRKHIPELPDFGEVVTIKNLLNHTNGFREIYNLMPLTGWKGEDDLLRDEAIRIIQKQPELQNAPGETFNYNNTAFILCALIVERITDQTFPEWMKSNVFDPLGMSKTWVRSNPAQIIPGASQGYSNSDQGFKESGDLYAAYGAGGIYTTVNDFAKWLANFSSPALGGEEVIEKLTTPGILNDGDTMNYALGIGVGEFRGLKRYQHGGADIAHRALLAYYPEIDAGVVALSNNASFSAGRLAREVAESFFGDNMEPEIVEIEEDGSITIDPEKLEAYAGKYKAEEIGLIIEYVNEDGSLVAEPQGQSSLQLIPLSDSSFSYEGIDATVVFRLDEQKEVKEATHTQGGNEVRLVKLPPYDPSPEVLEAFTGRYYSEELETFYDIVLDGDQLIARHRNMEDIELSPTEEDSFSGSTFFMGEVSFERSGNRIVSFKVSNGRTRGVIFERQHQ